MNLKQPIPERWGPICKDCEKIMKKSTYRNEYYCTTCHRRVTVVRGSVYKEMR